MIVVVLGLAACSGSTASVAPSVAPSSAPAATPTAVPTTAPTPSPTPADVSAVFIKKLASPDFKAAATITGTMSVGTVSGGITGSGAFSGPDSRTDLTITAGTFTQETASVSVGTTSWSRRSPGPWLEDPAKAAGSPDTSIGAVIKSMLSVTDLGVETRGGKSLHHLRSANGNAIPPAVFGVDPAVAKDAAFTLDFYATDDGTPAIMAIGGSVDPGEQRDRGPDEHDIRHRAVRYRWRPDDRATDRCLGPLRVEGARLHDGPSGRLDGQGREVHRIPTCSEGNPFVYVGVGPYKGNTASLVAEPQEDLRQGPRRRSGVRDRDPARRPGGGPPRSTRRRTRRARP